MIGGRIKRVLALSRTTTTFCLTYGDGVADIDITEASPSIVARDDWRP